MLQWRSHAGVDQGLKHLKRFGNDWSFEPGLIVWYADEAMDDNWVGNHPGEGWLGVVDADQSVISWSDKGEAAQTRFQVRDAAFSLQDQEPLLVRQQDGNELIDDSLVATASFDDRADYSNPGQPDAGKLLQSYGLKIAVVEQAEDNHYGVLEITLDDDAPVAAFGTESNGYTIGFVDASSDKEGEVTSWLWDFGDGVTSDEQNPTHTYAGVGTFSVTLTVTDQYGQKGTVVQDVVSNIAPQPELTVHHFGHWVLFTSFSSDSDGSVVDYAWSFGDGEQNSGAAWASWHQYAESGEYDVTLTITDNHGGQSTVTQTINVKGLWD
ncbi:PKD domain-containing protein [Veronia nyctiphanis]|uniref:PKD domain-containing protein n=1 Tax=Veronia nyctiphanis TaxID=1278244 RepID=UPI0038B5A9DF